MFGHRKSSFRLVHRISFKITLHKVIVDFVNFSDYLFEKSNSMKKIILLLSLSVILLNGFAQKAKPAEPPKEVKKDEVSLSGLKFRSIGPALTSGRISDFAVNPKKTSEYYVAVSSGGVWKTVNAGTTYDPIFDSQGSYSIGCVTLDPNNSNVVWVGTGENNNQRSVAYGDGVYKSEDGGSSWKNKIGRASCRERV